MTTILDAYAPGWEGEITRVDKMGDRISVTYRLTIHAAEGAFHQEDAGEEDEDKEEFGGTMAGAIATAMKRAAAKFGLGRLQGYDKDKKTAAFLEHLRGEKETALAELGKLLDAHGLSRESTLTWLKTQIAVHRTTNIPVWAIQALIQHLTLQVPQEPLEKEL